MCSYGFSALAELLVSLSHLRLSLLKKCRHIQARNCNCNCHYFLWNLSCTIMEIVQPTPTCTVTLRFKVLSLIFHKRSIALWHQCFTVVIMWSSAQMCSTFLITVHNHATKGNTFLSVQTVIFVFRVLQTFSTSWKCLHEHEISITIYHRSDMLWNWVCCHAFFVVQCFISHCHTLHRYSHVYCQILVIYCNWQNLSPNTSHFITSM